ncbi:MAG: DNA-3-methyladenine glycosylase I [Chitinophagaceae bacterium]
MIVPNKESTCEWPSNDPLMIQYHDQEWGNPLHDDQQLFEFLVLDAFQAGLSWRTILYKRENFRKAFNGFNPKQIARFSEKKIADLMENAGIVRNKLKIKGTIENARQFLKIQNEMGSFDEYIWQFTDFKTIVNQRKQGIPAQATSPQSDAMSKDLRSRGFKYVGSTICYAFMQAAGMVNDHLVTCFRYTSCKG